VKVSLTAGEWVQTQRVVIQVEVWYIAFMPYFICANEKCSITFYSKYKNAKYHDQKCAGQVNGSLNGKKAIHPPRYTDADLLTHLVELAQSLGRTPRKSELTYPSAYTYRKHFGSYGAAVIAAGLDLNIPFPKAYLEKTRNVVRLSLRFRVLKRDGFRCQYCGGTPQEGYILHVDHIQPRSSGGKTVLQNLITACYLCNEGKGSTL
jgi:hypothetical protein